MAIIEVTGTASNIWDLLLHIRNAASTNGYTVNEYIAGNPTLGVLRLQRNGKYYNLYAIDDDPVVPPSTDLGASLRISLSTGYSSSAAEGGQPEESDRHAVNFTNGPYSGHWFFIDDDVASQEALFAGVVEFQSGYFRSFCFGDARKQGSYTGGEVAGGVYWYQSISFIDKHNSSYHSHLFAAGLTGLTSQGPLIRADLNATTTYWRFGKSVSSREAYANTQTQTSYVGAFSDHIIQGPNDWNQRTLTAPIQLYTLDNSGSGSGRLVPRGYLPTVHIVNIRNYQPADVLPGTDYKVFPVARKRDPSVLDGSENSGEHGFAFKYK